MKQIAAISLLLIVMIGCDTLTNRNEKHSDDPHSFNYYDEERAQQIENAKQNKELIPGKWQIIKLKDTKTDEFEPAKNRAKELVFDTYEFLPRSEYVFYKGKKVVEKGTLEWMAEDREIVFTPNNDSPVNRLLIRGINNSYMNANSRTLYMILKKVKPATNDVKDRQIENQKPITHSTQKN